MFEGASARHEGVEMFEGASARREGDEMLQSPPARPESVARRGMRLIMRSLRAHPWPHAVAMIGALGFVFATVGGAWVLGWTTDNVIIADSAPRRDAVIAAVAVIAVSAASGVSVVMRRWFLAMAELRTQRDWRRGLLHQYLDLPMEFHRRRAAGELLAHVDSDVNTATMVLKPLAFAASVMALVLVTLAALYAAHPLLALIALVLFPALALISHIYTRAVEAPSAEVQRRVGEVSTVAHESLDGAMVVKTLGREQIEVQRLRDASERLRDERIKVGRMRGMFEPLVDALPTAGSIVLLLVGAWLVDQGLATPGDLVLAAMLFSLLAMPLLVVGFFLEEMPRSVVSLERVDSVLDLTVPSPLSAGPQVLGSAPLSVNIAGLGVRHGPHVVLNGVSLDVRAGETVALVGATGSGKSTLLEAIAGLTPAESGSIRLDGTDIADIGGDELHEKVALVFQEAFLFADSVAENLGLQRRSSPEGISAALAAAAAEDFVAALPEGQATVVGERGVTLSGGQRQRLALARALAGDPRLLMLDDATSAVDPVIEARMLRHLRNLDATVLIVAQRISTIELADRVAFLSQGRIVASGTHDELLARDDYRSLVSAYEQAQAAAP